MKRRISCFLFILVCGLQFSCVTTDRNDKNHVIPIDDNTRILEIIKKHSETPINEYKLLRAPSYPHKIKGILPEWSKSHSLILAIPYSDILYDFNFTHYYLELIKHSINYVNILILVDEEELLILQEIIQLLKTNNLGKYLDPESKNKITILTVNLDTLWIRDYGPLFAISQDNNIYLIDSIYDDIREKLSNDSYQEFSRNHDDMISIYLLNYFSNLFDTQFDIIRTPIQLWGGDFFTDGIETMFTSTETLCMNGGNIEEFNLILKYYMGIEKVIYLTPLPGRTIKHIDMFFKVVNENTFLLCEYTPQGSKHNIYIKFLEEEIVRVLEENYKLLRKNFPDNKIIRIPMPPIDYQLADHIKLELISLLAEYLKDDLSFQFLIFLDSYTNMEIFRRYVWKNHSSTDRFSIISDDNKLQRMMNEYDIQNSEEYSNYYLLSLIDDFDNFLDLIGDYEGVINNMLMEYPDAYNYYYYTYLNSIHINGDERDAVLIPSYKKSSNLEDKVKEVYQSIYPDTEIIFINSDEIIKQYGAIHCSTLLIPEIN